MSLPGPIRYETYDEVPCVLRIEGDTRLGSPCLTGRWLLGASEVATLPGGIKAVSTLVDEVDVASELWLATRRFLSKLQQSLLRHYH